MPTYLDKNKTAAFLGRSGAVVGRESFFSVKDSYNPFGEGIEVMQVSNYKGIGLKIAPWGRNNLKPMYFLELLSSSNINAQLITTKVNFAVGKGIYCYKEEIIDGKIIEKAVETPPEIKAFFKTIKVNKLMRSRATDFYILGNTAAKLILSRDARRGVAMIEHVDMSTVRAAIMNAKGQIKNYYVWRDWRRPKYETFALENEKKGKEHKVRSYPAFNEDEPLKYYQTVLCSKLYWTGQAYYGIQPWQFGHNWISYANKIPLWKLSLMEKGIAPLFHIQYPETYFDYCDNQGMSAEEKQKEKDRVFDALDQWLAGEQNAGKTFTSAYQIDGMTHKEFAGWIITPINANLQDEAFLDAFKSTNEAMTSSQDVDPSLASVNTGGKFGSSGSDKRISYQLHVALKVDEVRQIMIEPLIATQTANGWDENIKFGFRNKNVVTLAEDHGGMKDI